MSMSKLEIMTKLYKHIRTSNMTGPIEEQDEILAYCHARVNQLEAAEKEAEKPNMTNREARADLEARVGFLERTNDMVNTMFRHLRRDLKAHDHVGPTGKCYYP